MISKIAVYIRLSLADEETRKTKSESDSIGNQRMLINRFLDNHESLSKLHRAEFVDDGYTGTNFDRPQFQKMMSLVRAGEISVICVKDFSRFSRDYIETGNYLECVFPFLGVRFISVNDGYDSDDYKGTTGGLEVVMRNIIYAAYSKDLSVKTTTAKVQMMKQGKYVGGYAPYGYKMHPTVHNKLAINPDSARIVRRIFDEAMAGKNASEIAKGLNDDGIPTPGQYFRANHPGKNNFNYMSGKISWNPPMIYRILTKPVYTGATVGHAMKIAAPLSKKRVRADKSDWIIVENMHEPIVMKEEFDIAQKAIRKEGKKAPCKTSDYPLQGLVRCGNCRRAMRRRVWNGKAYFTCMNSMQDSDTECAIGHRYYEEDLERLALNAIRQITALAYKQEIQAKSFGDKQKSAAADCAKNLKNLQTQAEQLKMSKLRTYEKYVAGEISKQEYVKLKTEADEKLAANSDEQQTAEKRLRQLDSEEVCSESALQSACKSHNTEVLTYDLAHAFIKAIYVFQAGDVEIAWKFKDPIIPH